MEGIMIAVVEKFGVDALTEMASQMPGAAGLSGGQQIQSVDDLIIVEKSDNRVEYALSASSPASEHLTLIRIKERWYIQPPDAIAKQDPQMDQMMSMMTKQFSSKKPELRKLAQRIRNGDFATPMEAMMAMGQLMGGGAGGGVGGR